MHFNECIWLSIKSESVGSACWTHKRTMLSVGGAIHSYTCHHSPLLMLSVFGLRCSILRTYRQNIHPFISPTKHTQYTLTTHGLLYVVSRCADVCVCVCYSYAVTCILGRALHSTLRPHTDGMNETCAANRIYSPHVYWIPYSPIQMVYCHFEWEYDSPLSFNMIPAALIQQSHVCVKMRIPKITVDVRLIICNDRNALFRPAVNWCLSHVSVEII